MRCALLVGWNWIVHSRHGRRFITQPNWITDPRRWDWNVSSPTKVHILWDWSVSGPARGHISRTGTFPVPRETESPGLERFRSHGLIQARYRSVTTLLLHIDRNPGVAGIPGLIQARQLSAITLLLDIDRNPGAAGIPGLIQAR